MTKTADPGLPVPLPGGFVASALHCGLRKDKNHADLALLLRREAAPAAAIFTQNRLVGAHVHVCRDHLRKGNGLVRAVVVNARNANCATGQRGIDDARTVCAALAERIGCPPHEVLMMSTGPIGAPLPVKLLLDRLDDLLAAATPQRGADFARAIMTTDTFPKSASRTVDGASGRVTGFAKGAGMIHPDMATMLAFVLADVRPTAPLERLLPQIADRSFHRVTIDGDTSPNDTLLLWAAGTRIADAPFAATTTEVAQMLARDIAGDGEGNTRLVTVVVRGARDEREATHVGRTIATSPLVKTAIAGLDPNWGRILSAAGRAGVPFDAEAARVWVGPAMVYELGVPHPEREGEAHRHLAGQREVAIGVDLGLGAASAEVWTCDLTKDYVQINADYRS